MLASVTYFNASNNLSGRDPHDPVHAVNDGAALQNNLGTGYDQVAVTPINDAPTLAAIPTPAPILQNAGRQTINLSNITAGGGESQGADSVVVTSSNTAR